jgi:hypothetical protein
MAKIKFFSTDMMMNGDPLRTEIGNYFSISQIEDSTFKRIQPEFKLETEEIIDLRGFRIKRAQTNSDKIEFIQTNPVNIRPVNSNLYTPNFIIPFRLYANRDGAVSGDTDWLQFFTGGSIADKNYKNLIDTETVFYDTTFDTDIFDKFRNIKTIEYYDFDDGTFDEDPLLPCSIVTNYLDYDDLVQSYQNWSSGLQSELLIPNINIISEYVYSLSVSDSVRGTEEIQQGFSKNKAKLINYHFPDDDYYVSLSKNQYFGNFFINYQPIVNINDVIRHQENIIFDHRYFTDYQDDITSLSPDAEESTNLTIQTQLSTFYNVNIDFKRHINSFGGVFTTEYDFTRINGDFPPALRESSICEQIQKHNFSSKFLELLKDIDEGSIPQLMQKERRFNYEYKFPKPKYDTSGDYEFSELIYDTPNTPIKLKSMNMLNMLAYAYNNPEAGLNDNYTFMGFNHPEQVATFTNDTLYRTLNAQNTSKVIDSIIDLMKSYFSDLSNVLPGATSIEEVTDLSEDIIERIYGSTYKFTEVLAYKIEKIGGPIDNDNSEQNIIQKFWVFNSTDAPDNISITDSQVKYGEKYTYKISAYVCVMSHKYKYGDFRLTKQIGTDNLTLEGFPIGGDIEYCVEFYDPITKERMSQIFQASTDAEALGLIGSAGAFGPGSLDATNLSLFNQFANLSVDISEYPQLAEFNMYLEPCLEILEVPLLTKDVKVLDNPPNQINVVPFHFIDTSNRVGFKIGQDSFISKPFPTLITAADMALKNDYLKSKELIPIENINKISESPARFIEMYRIKEKPNSFADFSNQSLAEGGLVSRIDLRIPDDIYNYSDFIVSDQILTNTKYYYVFRLINENGLYGPLSQIIECELINDGGYVYALFDTIDSSEFNPDKTTKTTTSFKKIMQLEPNIDQMIFDLSDVDLNDLAKNQISNVKVGISDNKIWNEDSSTGGKKFKIRLTSKKTSKKLDLNVRFNLRDRDLTKTIHDLPVFDSEPVPGATVPFDPSLDKPPSEEEVG